MKPLPDFPNSLPEPRSYYRGADAPGRIRTRNAVVFLRTSRSNLQQRNFSNRVHHRHVLILVLETGGKASIDGELHALQPGTALLVLPYQFHHYVDLDSDKLRWLFITFEMEEGAERVEEIGHRVLYPGVEEQSLWRQIVRLWPQPGNAAELLSTLDKLLVRLARKETPALGQPLREGPAGSWITRVETLIVASVMDGTTLPEVAEQVGLSERHLRTRFEREMGVSIRRYKANYQLHRAAALMQQPELSLGRIAELCGFNTQAVFSRFIRRETGHSPSAWRRELLARH